MSKRTSKWDSALTMLSVLLLCTCDVDSSHEGISAQGRHENAEIRGSYAPERDEFGVSIKFEEVIDIVVLDHTSNVERKLHIEKLQYRRWCQCLSEMRPIDDPGYDKRSLRKEMLVIYTTKRFPDNVVVIGLWPGSVLHTSEAGTGWYHSECVRPLYREATTISDDAP